MTAPDTILINGKFATLDPANPAPEAVAITDKYFSAVGDASEILNSAGPSTKVINLSGRRAIPGLCDNHIHVIRGGLNFNMELRWDGVPSLADAMRMLRHQVSPIRWPGLLTIDWSPGRKAPSPTRSDQYPATDGA